MLGDLWRVPLGRLCEMPKRSDRIYAGVRVRCGLLLEPIYVAKALWATKALKRQERSSAKPLWCIRRVARAPRFQTACDALGVLPLGSKHND